MLPTVLKYSDKQVHSERIIFALEMKRECPSSLCGVKLVAQIDSVRNVQDVQQELEGWGSCREGAIGKKGASRSGDAESRWPSQPGRLRVRREDRVPE